MPLLNPPNTTTQLEEARRRLEEREQRKNRSFAGVSSSSRDRRASGQQMPPPQPPRNLPSSTSFDLTSSSESDWHSTSLHSQSMRVPSASAPITPSEESTVVGYYFCGEPIPYRTSIRGRQITLRQFKNLISKKGRFKYFFKMICEEFDDAAVIFEEVVNDDDVIP